jgi:GNAT superfamily N-acetyltransferase
MKSKPRKRNRSGTQGKAGTAALARRCADYESRVAQAPRFPKPPQDGEGTEYWGWTKEIDGLPGEWTYPIFGNRAQVFHTSPLGRLVFYDSIGNDDFVPLLIAITGQLAQQRVHPMFWPSISATMQVFRSIFSTRGDGLVPLPDPGEPSGGHHTVRLVGYEDEGDTWEFANSWGTEWGDKGYGKLVGAYRRKYVTEVWHYQIDRRINSENFHAVMDIDKLDRRTWLASAAKYTRLTEDQFLSRLQERIHIRMTDAVSLGTNRRVEVLEAVTNTGTRIGWAHLSHGFREDTESAVATEFFVWPPYRRCGIASMLESVIEQRAKESGFRSILLHIHEADAVACRQLATTAAQALGYRLSRSDSRRPNLALVGRKQLR